MATIPNSLGVTGPIAPLDSRDKYATHFAKYGQGGFYSVANVSELGTIPTARLGDGEPLIYTVEEEKWFLYVGGQWKEAFRGCCIGIEYDVDGDEIIDLKCGDNLFEQPFVPFGFDNVTYIENDVFS